MCSTNTNHQQMLSSLIENGVDFLVKAMDQFETDTKYSVINFYSAVEVLLKVPLINEHWSLVVSKGEADKKKYLAGDFVSVSFQEIQDRLKKVLERPLSSQAANAFNKVRMHRNKMVHFFHAGIENDQDTILLEQATAWFELTNYINHNWSWLFNDYDNIWSAANSRTRVNDYFAQAKFEIIQDEIRNLQSKGETISLCWRCNKQSVHEFITDLGVNCSQCLVCSSVNRTLSIKCPQCHDVNCGKVEDLFLVCSSCDFSHNYDRHELFSLLDDSKISHPDDYSPFDGPINCNKCGGYHTVCNYKKGYLCVSCLEEFDDSQLSTCDYCSDPMTGEIDGTYAFGCNSCSGAAGNCRD